MLLQLGKSSKGVHGGIERIVDEIEEITHSVTIRYHKRSVNIASQPISVLYIVKTLYNLFKVKLVLLHYPNYLGTLLVLLAKFLGKRVVVFWHNDVLAKGEIPLLDGLDRYMVGLSDKVIVTSPQYPKYSRILNMVPDDKLELVNLFPSLLPINRTQINNSERKDLLFVGRLVPYKGLEVLFEAVRDLDIRLNIVGSGNERYVSDLKSLAPANVVFKGKVSDKHLKALYQNALCLVLPSISRQEGFGIVLLESFSQGNTVITSDVLGSGMTWANVSNETGLVFKNADPIDLRTKIEFLIDNPNKADSYRKNAHTRYKEHFTRELFRENILRAIS